MTGDDRLFVKSAPLYQPVRMSRYYNFQDPNERNLDFNTVLSPVSDDPNPSLRDQSNVEPPNLKNPKAASHK